MALLPNLKEKVRHDISLLKKPNFPLQSLSINSILVILISLFSISQVGVFFWPEWAFVRGIRVDYLSPSLFLIDILLIVYIFIPPYISSRILRRILFLFIFLLLYTFAFSVNPMASSIFVLRLLMYVLVFQKLRSETNLLQKVTAPFSVALLISLFLSLLQIFHGRTIGGMFYFLGERTFSTTTPGIALFDSAGQLFLRPYATFPHPNVLSGFSLLVLAILLFKPKKRTIEYLGILSAIMLILLSASEGALIALLLLGAYLAVRKQVGIDLSVVMIISFVMASFLQLYIAPSIINMDLPEQFTKRAELVLIAREYILSNPLSGVGGGAFVTDLPNQWEKSSYLETSFSWFLQPVHNIPLLLVSEWGVLIAACLLFCVFYSLKNVSNKHLFVSGLIVTFATGFIDHYWVTIGQTRLVLVIWLALVFSKNSATMQNRNDKKN